MKYQLKGKYFDGIVHPRKAHTILPSIKMQYNPPGPTPFYGIGVFKTAMSNYTIEANRQIAQRKIRRLRLLAILAFLAFIAVWAWLFFSLTKLGNL